jgi:hypothetical protein
MTVTESKVADIVRNNMFSPRIVFTCWPLLDGSITEDLNGLVLLISSSGRAPKNPEIVFNIPVAVRLIILTFVGPNALAHILKKKDTNRDRYTAKNFIYY